MKVGLPSLLLVLLVAMGLCVADPIHTSSQCHDDVQGHITQFNTPLTVDVSRFICYVALTIPTLKPDQGYSITHNGPTQVGISLMRYISNSGNTYTFDCDSVIGSQYTDQVYLYPCRPESPEAVYLNVSEWVVELASGVQRDDTSRALATNTISVQSLYTPVVQQQIFGDFVITADVDSPIILQFSTTSQTSSIYLFLDLSQSGAYVRITRSQCDDIVFLKRAEHFLEENIPLAPSTTYYLYIGPFGAITRSTTHMIYPVSTQCTADCDKDGGICYNNKCTCKQGYQGDKCELLACDSVAPKPCHCNVLGTVTPKGLKISKAGPLNYFNLEKPTPAGDGHGWKIRVHPVDYWTNYYFNVVDQDLQNNCPRNTSLLPLLRTDYGGYPDYTIEVGFRPCSPELEKYTNVSEYVFRIDGAINTIVYVDDIPAPVALELKLNTPVSGTISDWYPVLYKLDVPAGVTNATLTFDFNTMSSIYHTLTVTLSPCQYAGVKNVVYGLDNATSGKMIISLTAGTSNYLLLDSQYSPQGISYKFVLST